MSKRKHRRRDFETPLQRYGRLLLASGMEEREAARAYFYAERYGVDAVQGEPGDGRCLVFAEPTCGDWNCVAPEHQVPERV